MIACYAWTNTQIINITNAVINLYPGEHADIYIRMGGHISDELVDAIRESGVYDNVFPIDPFHFNYRRLKFGFIPKFRALFLKPAYQRAYGALLDRLCKGKVYTRVLLAWFYTENVFLLEYWARSSPNFAVTLVDEGTGSYCYHKNQILFPLSLLGSKKDRLKRYIVEGRLSKQFAKSIDSFALYRPEYSRPDIDFDRLRLPEIHADTNPLMYQILKDAARSVPPAQYDRYNSRDLIYFSSYSNSEGKLFDQKSLQIINAMMKADSEDNILIKVHMGNSIHGAEFAQEYEDRLFVDRNIYIFEGLYSQLEHPEEKVLVSCASTTAINPKFMFGIEPYVIFTYRLYDTYRQVGVERDDWLSAALIDSYTDKSRILIPNSLDELRYMLTQLKNDRLNG